MHTLQHDGGELVGGLAVLRNVQLEQGELRDVLLVCLLDVVNLVHHQKGLANGVAVIFGVDGHLGGINAGHELEDDGRLDVHVVDKWNDRPLTEETQDAVQLELLQLGNGAFVVLLAAGAGRVHEKEGGHDGLEVHVLLERKQVIALLKVVDADVGDVDEHLLVALQLGEPRLEVGDDAVLVGQKEDELLLLHDGLLVDLFLEVGPGAVGGG
jgi:hypothetical protein